MLGRFLASRRGATSIEYALVAGFVSIAVVVSLQATGNGLNAKFFTPLAAAFR